jgi:phosphate transport system permease protein
MRLGSYRNSPLSLVIRILVAASAVITAGITFSIIIYVLAKGIPELDTGMFSWKYTEENQSMLPAIINTVYMVVLSLLISVPVGIASAIYLTEYAKRGNKFVSLIRITAETLSGIPSIVYGLVGYLIFVTGMKLGLTLLGGALTLAIMILPLIMRTTEESLLSVPDSFREGSYGVGAGRLRTIFRIILPSAVPGILAGVILAAGRISGETAALLFTAGSVARTASSLLSSSRTLSVHMYIQQSEGLHMDEAFATAVVLLIIVMIINMAAEYIAGKIKK